MSRLQRYGHSTTVDAEAPQESRNSIPLPSLLGDGSGASRAIMEHVGFAVVVVASAHGRRQYWQRIGGKSSLMTRPV